MKLSSAILIVLNILLSISCYAQTSEQDVLLVAEEMPEFPGGVDSMEAFILKNLEYPSSDAECTGTAFVSFIVETTGALSNIKIEKSVCRFFGEELIKVFQKMPPWKAGKQNGEPVRLKMILPVRGFFD